MRTHQCRRKKQIEVNDERTSVKNVIVLDANKNYSLFPECVGCGYGSKSRVLKTKEPTFETYEIKTCTLRAIL